MKLFSIFGRHNPKLSVISSDEDSSSDYLESLNSESQWQHREVFAGPGKLVDFPTNNFVGWSLLCSSKMKSTLEPFAKLFIWLSVTVIHVSEEHPYFVLFPVSFPDVLDEQSTVRSKADGSVVKPVFSKQKMEDIELFVFDRDCEGLVCSERVRKKLLDNGISGLEFSPEHVI